MATEVDQKKSCQEDYDKMEGKIKSYFQKISACTNILGDVDFI